MQKLLIATGNEGKVNMFRRLLSDYGDLDILYLKDFEKVEELAEDGETPEDNTLIKARYYSERFGLRKIGSVLSIC